MCNSRGNCTTPNVCACTNGCSIGPYCEDEICSTTTIVSLVSSLTVFTSGTNFNITVDIARTFVTSQAVNAVRCGYVDSVGAPTYFAVYKISNTRFVCTITSATAQSMNVNMYIGSVVITSNSLQITAIIPGYVFFCFVLTRTVQFPRMVAILQRLLVVLLACNFSPTKTWNFLLA